MEGADSKRNIAALADAEKQQSSETSENDDSKNECGKGQTDFSFDILNQTT